MQHTTHEVTHGSTWGSSRSPACVDPVTVTHHLLHQCPALQHCGSGTAMVMSLEHRAQPEHSTGQPGPRQQHGPGWGGRARAARHVRAGCGGARGAGGGHLRDSAAVPRPCAEPAVARPRAMGSRNAQRLSSGCAPRQAGSGRRWGRRRRALADMQAAARRPASAPRRARSRRLPRASPDSPAAWLQPVPAIP